MKKNEKKAAKKLDYCKRLKKIQLCMQRINGVKKYQRQEILKRLKVGDFSKLEETKSQLSYKKVKDEYKALELITKRLESKSVAFA